MNRLPGDFPTLLLNQGRDLYADASGIQNEVPCFRPIVECRGDEKICLGERQQYPNRPKGR